jgi:hypothetical protein
MTDQVESKDPALVADPQDPLPESNWLWRRLLVFLIVGFIGWQQMMAANRIARWGDGGQQSKAIDALLDMTHWHISFVGVVLLLYLVAPSAEQFAKIVQTVSAWKSGISTLTTSRISTPAGTASTSTAAGPAKSVAAPVEELPEYAR